MILIRHTNNNAFFNLGHLSLKSGCVATIGNFDGLHCGHQAIFEQLKKQAATLKLPAVVITFEPLPKEYFLKSNPEKMPSRLTRFKEKWKYLKEWGIDIMVCLHFDHKLAQMSADYFMNDFLIKKLHIKHLIVGEDFHFGHNREGDLNFLKKQAKCEGFALEVAPAVLLDNMRISSTRVREALKTNNLMLSQRLLGRPYSLLGKVIHGDKRARQWGIPTANLNVHRSILPTVLPVKGVYAVSVDLENTHGIQRLEMPGVANVGRRPTVNGFRHLLEVHLLNFNEVIYDQIIEVKFLHKLRDEQRFESVDLLKQQILQDVETAKQYFSL